MSAQSRIAGPASRWATFGTTIFAEMTALAAAYKAVNLSQGFPDFDGPGFVKQAAIEAIRAGHGQYARMLGLPALNAAIASSWARAGGRALDPDAEVTVTSGCTEALAAAMLGLVEPEDEVVLFEPAYDSYAACVTMAGARARFVALRERTGRFEIDWEEFDATVGPRTRAIVVNTPHNPTGKVFTREELIRIGAAAERHNAIIISDEVYERLIYAGACHASPASIPGLESRVVVCSSLGKTFSLTGWKIGWTIAPPALSAGVRAAHQFLAFAIATPLQHGAVAALSDAAGEEYIRDLRRDYTSKRAFLGGALARLGFRVIEPEGTYFIMADHRGVGGIRGLHDDRELCRWLVREAGVAAIPPSAFCSRAELGASFVRFAFCKRQETLELAVERLERALA